MEGGCGAIRGGKRLYRDRVESEKGSRKRVLREEKWQTGVESEKEMGMESEMEGGCGWSLKGCGSEG